MHPGNKILHLTPPSDIRRPGLTFDLDLRAHEARLAVTGELDLATQASLCATAAEVLQPPVRALLLDLGGVSFCGAAGVTSLLTIRRAAADADILLVLTGLQPSVRHVLDLLGTSTLIPIAPTRPVGTLREDVGRRARAA
jgi:anti-anti-sigma factor